MSSSFRNNGSTSSLICNSIGENLVFAEPDATTMSSMTSICFMQRWWCRCKLRTRPTLQHSRGGDIASPGVPRSALAHVLFSERAMAASHYHEQSTVQQRAMTAQCALQVLLETHPEFRSQRSSNAPNQHQPVSPQQEWPQKLHQRALPCCPNSRGRIHPCRERQRTSFLPSLNG